MAIDWTLLESEAIEVFRVVAPCMAGVPFVIVDQAKVGMADYLHGAFVAYKLDHIARKHMPNAPANRFACIVYNQKSIKSIAVNDDDAAHKFMAMMLHELGHFPEMRIIDTWTLPPLSADRLKHIEERIVAHCRLDVTTLTDDARRAEERYLLYSHPPAFLRICSHLLRRARKLAKWKCLSLQEVHGIRVGQSHPWNYYSALGDEPERLKDLSLAEPVQARNIKTRRYSADVFRSSIRKCSSLIGLPRSPGR
jgi:hypothetical protein